MIYLVLQTEIDFDYSAPRILYNGQSLDKALTAYNSEIHPITSNILQFWENDELVQEYTRTAKYKHIPLSDADRQRYEELSRRLPGATGFSPDYSVKLVIEDTFKKEELE